MGQRSQIYVRMRLADGRKILFPRYYQWNYGERMVSRARGIIEWLETYAAYPDYFNDNKEMQEKLNRIMDTNFDYRDIVLGQDLIKEYYDMSEYGHWTFNQYVFEAQDNNDGQLFIDLQTDFYHKSKNGDYKYVIKYGFRDIDNCTPMDPEQYMDWDYEDWRTSEHMKDCVKLTERNISWIKKHAKLMTAEEMNEFIHHDYVKDMQLD